MESLSYVLKATLLSLSDTRDLDVFEKYSVVITSGIRCAFQDKCGAS